MPVERSAGIILFQNTPDGRRYLTIRSSYHGNNGKHNFWDFPKGLLEPKEQALDAACREATEEAGISDFTLIKEFKETVKYFIRRDRDKKATLKFVALFLAESDIAEVKLSWEHDAYEWLPFEKARDRISIPQMKKALEKADEFLMKKV